VWCIRSLWCTLAPPVRGWRWTTLTGDCHIHTVTWSTSPSELNQMHCPLVALLENSNVNIPWAIINCNLPYLLKEGSLFLCFLLINLWNVLRIVPYWRYNACKIVFSQSSKSQQFTQVEFSQNKTHSYGKANVVSKQASLAICLSWAELTACHMFPHSTQQTSSC